MRRILFIFSFAITIIAQGQFLIQGIQPNSSNLQVSADTTVLTLPFWEDFSTSSNSPDTAKWISGSDVFINTSLGINPPTYKLATFDGLRKDGNAHDIANSFNGPGDSLVSLPIDLSSVSVFNQATTYLSFYWQAKGNGEIPEANDSLVLYFSKFNPDTIRNTTIWDRVWVQTGGEGAVDSNFTQVILPLDSPSYFFSEFQFKFVSYGGKTGPFDTWHIDYIYINENRNANDLSHFDRSLTGSPSLLFQPYYEVPAEHFYTDPTSIVSSQTIQASNLDQVTLVGHPLEYYYTLRDLSNDVLLDSVSLGNGGLGGLKPSEIRTIQGPDNLTLNFASQPDSLVLESSFFYLTNDKPLFEEVNGSDTVFLPVHLNTNDQIKTQYLLQNHYAYDDGSAEFAVAINAFRGQLAVKFDLIEPDTITDIDIYFPSIAPEAAGSSVDILIWDRLDDNHIRTRQTYTIEGPTGLNEFKRIKLSKPVVTRDSIFIGYQQFTDNYIGIGFDRNNTDAGQHIYSNVTGEWVQNSTIHGAIMIRPVFGYDSIFASSELNIPMEIKSVKAYPNPSSGVLKIDGLYDSLELYSLTGQLVYQSEYREFHDVTFLDNGIYLLLLSSDTPIKSQKVVIRK
ncbi:MAG: T9SS type A sorting domain-containing protein [Cyclobacteriaceae bacterium]